MSKGKKFAASKSGVNDATTKAGELLLEIGVEELPYQFIPSALTALETESGRALGEARLSYRAIRSVGTPRRLTLVVEGLAGRQASMVKEAMGPPKSVAFDQAGQPTKAAMGFATGQGVAVRDLQVRQTTKGEYLFAVKRDEGRVTKLVLQELLPQLITQVSFPKSMRWNESGARFARPVRWLVALYNGVVLPIEVAGIKAGNRTRGHRVLGKTNGIVVRGYESYVKGLERQGVVPDPARRRRLIEEQITAICKKTGFKLNVDLDLLEQAVYTTEFPHSMTGSFQETYLDVPEQILITSMKEHQGFFSLINKKTGKLVPHFIAVVNNQARDMTVIREGNERVLAARLADARFFYFEDRKTTLAERAAKLSGVVFHQKLGTMSQKQERMIKLTVALATQLGLSEHLLACCRRAAELCKADLLSGIVGEFPTLQGIMGGYYARHDKEDPEVCTAISQQYLPRGMEGDIPSSQVAQILSIADRLDSIAAFFHVGMIPTGSEDPFALRRHATAVVRILSEAVLSLDLGKAIQQARAIVAESGIKAAPQGNDGQQRLIEFIFERVRHYGKTCQSLRDDVMTAVVKAVDKNSFFLRDMLAKMNALQAVTSQKDFDQLMVGFKRAHRLTEKEQWDQKPVEPSLFLDPSESELYAMVNRLRQRMIDRMKAGRYDESLDSLIALKPAIDAFFAAVMVNTDDKAIRSNRLSLLKEVDEMFMSFADFSQVVVQGPW